MSTRPPLRHRLTAALTLLVYVSLLLLVPSCGDQGSKTITGAREAVPSYSCEDTLTGQVTPAAPIEGVSNIRYRLGRDGTIRLELLDAAAAVIGTVQITIEMILGSQFGANIDASYEEGGEVKASQSTQVRLAGGRWLGRTRQAVGQNHALLWSALDLDGKLAELSLGAPLAAGAVPAGTAANEVAVRAAPEAIGTVPSLERIASPAAVECVVVRVPMDFCTPSEKQCLVQRAGRATMASVEPGLIGSAFFEVRAGLSAGDVVVAPVRPGEVIALDRVEQAIEQMRSW